MNRLMRGLSIILLGVVTGLLPIGRLCAGQGPPAAAAAPATLPDDPERLVECRNGVVVSVAGPASDIGVAVLKRGGNAVDAAVATAFALAVAHPRSGNIGGGGIMLVHPAPGKGDPLVIDYRESAPAAARPTMFAKNESQHTHRAVAIPGTVRGMARAHARFGTHPWAELIRPAVALAQDGFLFDQKLAESLNVTLAEAPEKAEFQRVFGKPGGGRWERGDRLKQPDLARTLRQLADLGPDSFYTGPIAEAIVAEIARGKGLITADDLAGYKAIERKPLTTRFRGEYDVYVPPPPSSGGICLIEELHMLESFDLKARGRWSPTTLHVLAEIMRRANYDRALYLGDPAFVEIPAKLTDRDHARRLAKTIDPARATRSESIAAELPLSREENTTHFSIIDHDGMAVANTYTLERHWGSRVVVEGAGFLLNNDMWAFNLFPGVTDTKGTIGTPPNTIAPGKRPLTSQTPTILARGGHVQLVTGTPGSRSIPHTVLQILLNVYEFEMPLRMAVGLPRMSHQWFPDQITFEEPESYPDAMAALKAMGHTVVRTGPLPQGDAHTILVIEPNRYVGAADPRLNGKASGY